MLIILRSTRILIFPLGFLCAKMGPVHFEKGINTMIPYLFTSASLKIKSSFRWNDLGKLFAVNRLLIFWCKFQLEPRARPNIRLVFCKNVLILHQDIFYSLILILGELSISPIKPFKEFAPWFSAVSGLDFPFSCHSVSSSKIRVWIVMWFSFLPRFSGVGKQKVLFCCSGFLL